VKKALITGGAGFIGLHLARQLLTHGYRVDLLDNFSRGVRDDALEAVTANPGVRCLSSDLLDPRGLEGLDRDYTHVVHLAAIIGVANVAERPFAVLRDNVDMLLRILELARGLARLERVLFASTSEVYAGTLEHFELPIPTPETTALALGDLARPRTSYALSKIYGEALCHHSGLPFTIVRPHNVYGPRMGMQHVVPELLQRAYRSEPGQSLEVFSADHTRSFCYVADAVEMIHRLAEADGGKGGTFNVGAAREITIREMADIVIRTVGKPLTIRPGPVTAGSPPRRVPDMTHTLSVSGYMPVHTVEEGVRLTFEWYREHLFAKSAPTRSPAA
jgi:nucleoside-diphosphate-sugar epimerase